MMLFSSEEVSEKATLLIKEMFTNLGPKLQATAMLIHEDFVQVKDIAPEDAS